MPAVGQVLVDNLIDILFRSASIPYPLGVDHHARAKFTAIKAASTIHAGFADAGFFNFCFHVVA